MELGVSDEGAFSANTDAELDSAVGQINCSPAAFQWNKNSDRIVTKALAKRGHIIVAATLRPAVLPVRGKTRQHCCAWRQEMFLKIFRNIFCVQDTKFVSDTNVARVAKRVNIWGT